MKIANSTSNYINQAYVNKTNTPSSQNLKAQSKVEETPTDSLNISNRTKSLQLVSRSMETEPMDREKYVADIKQKIETNQYDMNAEATAEKMVGHFMNGKV